MRNYRLLLACMGITLYLAGHFFINIITVRQKGSLELWLHPNAISGMSIVAKGIPYTLNFAQRETLLRLLNSSSPLPEGEREALSPFPKMENTLLIHRFNQKDLALPLQGVHEEQLLFLVEGEWKQSEPSPGIQGLLEESYDHSIKGN